MTVLSAVTALVAVGWVFIFAIACYGQFCLPDLAAADSKSPVESKSPPRPAVSVVIPTRDEAERLPGTVARILAQRGVEIELIVVDDRSEDATPEILAAMDDPRLRVVRVDTLPEGWLGKCHACHVGAQVASHPWLLFLDADSWLAEDALLRAAQSGERDEADHVCLVPGLGDTTFLGRATVSMLTLGLFGIAAGVNKDRGSVYLGIGAFTMMRRTAYEVIGGHETVRLHVIEDFALGYLIRKAGLRTRVYWASSDLEVRWAHSVRSFFQVLEKNLFAKLGFSLWRALGQMLAVALAWALPLFAWIWVPLAIAMPALAAFLAVGIPAAAVARRHGWSAWAGIVGPLTLPLVVLATARSTWVVLAAGGVRWRDTFYPLAELRAFRVEVD